MKSSCLEARRVNPAAEHIIYYDKCIYYNKYPTRARNRASGSSNVQHASKRQFLKQQKGSSELSQFAASHPNKAVFRITPSRSVIRSHGLSRR